MSSISQSLPATEVFPDEINIPLGMTVQFLHCSFTGNQNERSVILNQNGAVVIESSLFDQNDVGTIIRVTNNGFFSADDTCFRDSTYKLRGVIYLSKTCTLFWKDTNYGSNNVNRLGPLPTPSRTGRQEEQFSNNNCNGAYQEPVCASDEDVKCHGLCSPFLSRQCNARLVLDATPVFAENPLTDLDAQDAGITQLETPLERHPQQPRHRSVDKSHAYSISILDIENYHFVVNYAILNFFLLHAS